MDPADGFLDAICAAPDDDTPRLVFADWLDEHGEAERAEFIRVQCLVERWAGTPGDPEGGAAAGAALARSQQLTDDFGFDWFGAFVRAAGLDGGRGPDRHGWHFRSLGATLGWCQFRRGFVASVTLSCAAFLRHAGALFACQPVEAVTLSDKHPFSATGRGRWLWFPGPRRCGWHVLPWKLFDALPGGEVMLPEGRAATARLYPLEADARAAVSAAAVAFGRAEARKLRREEVHAP